VSLDAPKESFIVVILLLYNVSVFIYQHYQKQQYKHAREAILTNASVQRYFLDKFDLDLVGSRLKLQKTGKKKSRSRSKKGKEEESSVSDELQRLRDTVTDEQLNKAISELNIVVVGWTGGQPTLQDSALRMPLAILNVLQLIVFQIRFFVKYHVLKQRYSDGDREYLCRTHFKLSQEEWDAATEEYRNDLMNKPGPWRKKRKGRQGSSTASSNASGNSPQNDSGDEKDGDNASDSGDDGDETDEQKRGRSRRRRR